MKHHKVTGYSDDTGTEFSLLVTLTDTGIKNADGKSKVDYLVTDATTLEVVAWDDKGDYHPAPSYSREGLQSACALVDLLGYGMAFEDEENQS